MIKILDDRLAQIRLLRLASLTDDEVLALGLVLGDGVGGRQVAKVLCCSHKRARTVIRHGRRKLWGVGLV